MNSRRLSDGWGAGRVWAAEPRAEPLWVWLIGYMLNEAKGTHTDTRTNITEYHSYVWGHDGIPESVNALVNVGLVAVANREELFFCKA